MSLVGTGIVITCRTCGASYRFLRWPTAATTGWQSDMTLHAMTDLANTLAAFLHTHDHGRGADEGVFAVDVILK